MPAPLGKFHQTVGWVGSALLALCAFPQALASYQTGTSAGIDSTFLGMWAAGEALLLAYILPLKLWPLVASSILDGAFLVVIIWFKVWPS